MAHLNEIQVFYLVPSSTFSVILLFFFFFNYFLTFGRECMEASSETKSSPQLHMELDVPELPSARKN